LIDEIHKKIYTFVISDRHRMGKLLTRSVLQKSRCLKSISKTPKRDKRSMKA